MLYEVFATFYQFQVILSEHIDPNLLNSNGATPLHFARKPAIIKVHTAKNYNNQCRLRIKYKNIYSTIYGIISRGGPGCPYSKYKVTH